MTTPTWIQSNTGSATATSVAVSFNSAVTAGNTILAYGKAASAVTLNFSDNINGIRYARDAGPTGAGLLLIGRFKTPLGAGAGAFTVTLTSSSSVAINLTIQEWSGIDALIPVEQSTAIATSTSTTPSPGATATLAESGELVVSLASTGSSTTWTAATGFTMDPIIVGSVQRAVEYQVVSGTGAVTPSFTIGSSLLWNACSACYRSSNTTRKQIAITTPGAGTFTAPADWPGIADKAEVIGGGAAGRAAATNEGLGGGGGAYTFINALTLNNGDSLQVGAGGSSSAQSGTPTWLKTTGTLFADFGKGAAATVAGGAGLLSNCIPTANASSGGAGGTYVASATAGASGGGGAATPLGASAATAGTGGAGGAQSVTGTTGGTGGGAAGAGGVASGSGTAQSASNQAGTAGGNYSTFSGIQASTGGAGGASGLNAGSPGSSVAGSTGSGGGGGGSDGTGGGGAGGNGGAGQEWSIGGTPYGSGGGGGGTGQQSSGSSPSAGNGGLYGGGGGGGGNGTATMFGTGGAGIIVITYTPVPSVVSTPGGTGKPARRAKIKRSREIFQDEMRALEQRLEEAREVRASIETTLTDVSSGKGDMVHQELRNLTHGERALRAAQMADTPDPAAIPVYVRIPKKSVGVRRVEAIERLQTLARIARYREEIASEKLRKIREKIDEDAAVAFMQAMMRES